MRVEPTLALTDAARQTWDVLVIGAGPAGAVAAYQASRASLSVLLVERKAFPRAKVCGGCVNAGALALLDSIGLGGILGDLGGVPLRRFALECRGRRLETALPEGLAVTRAALDGALVRAAISVGARFLPETAAAVEPADPASHPNHRHVLLQQAAESETARARVIVAADGLGHSSLHDEPALHSEVAEGARIGLGTVLPVAPSGIPPGVVQLHLGRHGYVGTVRAERDQLIVAAAAEPEFVRRQGGAGPAVAALIEESGQRLIPLLAECDWHGTPPLTRRLRHPAAHRVLAVGDAAGYVEPFTGEGIGWAIAAAVAAVPIVERGVKDWQPSLGQEWSRTLQQRLAHRQRRCRALALSLRHPVAVSVLLRIFSALPVLANAVARRISAPPPTWKVGHT